MARFSNITCSAATADYACRIAEDNVSGNQLADKNRVNTRRLNFVSYGLYALLLAPFVMPYGNVLAVLGAIAIIGLYILGYIGTAITIGATVYMRRVKDRIVDGNSIETYLFTNAVARNTTPLYRVWVECFTVVIDGVMIAYLYYLNWTSLAIMLGVLFIGVKASRVGVRSLLRSHLARLDRRMA